MRALILIARRYLLSHKSHSVVNIIAGLSFVSLLIPVAAVIVLLSIFNGFSSMICDMDSAIDGDLTIGIKEGKLFDQGEIDVDMIGNVEGVESLSFSTEQTLLIEYKGEGSLLTLRGVDDNYTSTVPIERHVEVGKFQVELGELERIVIGNSVASKLGIRTLSDTTIDIYALKTSRLQSLIPMGSYNSDKAKLSGILMLDIESEERYAYASQRLVNKLLETENSATKLSIKVAEGYNIHDVQKRVSSILDSRFKIESREELNPAIYQIIRYEKLGIMLICTLVIILASFSLLGALTMLIIEKQNDVTTLRVMGITQQDIRRIYLIEGYMISSSAIVIGVIIGIAVTLIQQFWGVVELPSSSMVLQYYPVKLQLWDVVGTITISSAISLILCYLTVNRVYKEKL